MQFLIDIALSLIYFGAFLLLSAWTWRFWKMYVNQRFLNKLNDEFIMLEIRLPREIFKSPLATEVALTSLLQTSGVGNWYQTQFLGNLPLYASVEIASIEGVIHFYVRVLNRFRELVEENFYAQYPGIEIVEVEDYTRLIRYTHLSESVSCWGEEYTLGEKWNPTDPKTGAPSDKKMRADFYPIKTYTDFGLDQNPKEEFKIDPISVLMEFMGSLAKGEHLWYQIIFQDEKLYDGKKMPKVIENPVTHEHWNVFELVDAFKKQVRGGFKPKGAKVIDQYGYEVKEKGEEGKEGATKTYQADIPTLTSEAALTVEQKWMIEMANKKLGKPLTMATIRMMYVVDTKKANKFNGQHIQKILAYPKPYVGANSLAYKTATDPYSYPWERMGGKRVSWRTEEMFEAYVEREAFFPHIPERKKMDKFEDRFFWGSSMKTRKMWRLLYEAIFHPFSHPHPDVFALNLEEIATLWHLPGTVVTTPTLPRIDSAKAVAPVNLPQ